MQWQISAHSIIANSGVAICFFFFCYRGAKLEIIESSLFYIRKK
jgi:hypothetical protein